MSKYKWSNNDPDLWESLPEPKKRESAVIRNLALVLLVIAICLAISPLAVPPNQVNIEPTGIKRLAMDILISSPLWIFLAIMLGWVEDVIKGQ